MNWVSRMALVALAVWLTSCLPPLRGPDPVVKPLPYKKAIRVASRETRQYHRFISALDATVVFLSWDVRLAGVEETRRVRQLDEETREHQLVQEMEHGSRYLEFLVGAYATHEDWVDLAEVDPTWSMVLVSGDRWVAPIQIRTWEPSDAERWLFFPEMSPWAELYQVRFPAVDPESGLDMIDPAMPEFMLEFRSLFGTTRCEWRFAIDA